MPDPSDLIPATQAQAPFFAGVDVGGTNTKIGLVDDLGRTVAFESIVTNAEAGPEDAVGRMADCLKRLLQSAGVEGVAHVGLATPGPIDLQQGIITGAGNLPTWWHYPIVEELAKGCGAPVRFANDANAAAFGEFWAGAGKDDRSIVLLTLGTGVGGGIIVDGHLVEGSNGCGGECGHVLIVPDEDAPADSLGKTGSLEAYCGAYSVVRRTEEALWSGVESSLRPRLEAGEDLTPRVLFEEAVKEDRLSLDVILQTADYLALGVVSLIHAIDPDRVVLGGAMTFGGAGHPLGERFIARVRDTVRPRLLQPLREGLRVDFATLGGDAGYVGAAGLARDAAGVSR